MDVVNGRFATFEQKWIIYLRDNGRCHYCDEQLSINNFHADHIDPWLISKDSSISNLVASCYMCNGAKHSLPYDTFVQLLEEKGLEWRRKKYFSTVSSYRQVV